MPQVEVDIENIPDIIEAQLTLSYSRLSDLIRIIVDQGNSHDEEITGIHDDVSDLRDENERLKKEIEALKARESDKSLLATVEFLKKEVERLSTAYEGQSKEISAHNATHTAEEKAIRELLDTHEQAVKDLSEALAETDEQVKTHESRLGFAEAFTELWGTHPEQLFTMAARTNPADPNSDHEHSLEARTQYLHTLPAFASLFDELNVVRGMLRKQSAEAIATKSEMRSRQSSDAGSATAQDALLKAIEALESRVLAVENGRLPPLEEAVANGAVSAAAAQPVQAAPPVDLSGVEKTISQTQDRLSLLEDRLRALLGQQATDVDGVSGLAFADLTHRVEWLEEVVEGLPASQAAAAAAADDAAARAVGVDAASERRTPEGPAAATPSAESPSTVTAEAASPVPQSPSSASVPSALQRPGSANAKTARPPSGRGSGALPPISPIQSADSNAGTPAAGRTRNSVLGSQLNVIPQPVLEALKAQEEEQPRDQRRVSRSISVAVEPEDGLRRRVAILEENCAILEVNKADRGELQALEEAIRQALARHQLSPLPAAALNPSTSGAAMAPRRPPSARVSLTDNTGYGVPDGLVSRPRSMAGGRPMFVGSSAVYLRDGATRTQVTVSPTRLSGTH